MRNKKLFLVSILIFTLLFTSQCFALDFTQLQINYNRSVRSVAPQWIAIHDTGNLNPYANAWMHYQYFNSGDKQSSADVFIDRNKIYFINNTDKFYTWAVGDKYYNWHHPYCQNYNSVSIEMCMNDQSVAGLQEVFNKTVETTKYLMSKYNIPADHVLRHYDITRKPCPQNFPMWDSSPYVNTNWIRFKNAVVAKPVYVPTEYELYVQGIKKSVEKGYLKDPNFWYNIESKDRETILKYTKQLIRNIGQK